jgi:translation initiation factor RLI1
MEVIEGLLRKGHWIDELVGKKKDGSLFNVQFSASVVKDEKGNLFCMMGSFLDITERKRAEEQIKASLKEKDVLLQEIHHRVKNNMQVITCKSQKEKTYFFSPTIFLIILLSSS